MKLCSKIMCINEGGKRPHRHSRNRLLVSSAEARVRVCLDFVLPVAWSKGSAWRPSFSGALNRETVTNADMTSPIVYTWPDVVTYLVDDPDVYPGYLPPEERYTLCHDYRESPYNMYMYDTESEDSSTSGTPFDAPLSPPSPCNDSRTAPSSSISSGSSSSRGTGLKRTLQLRRRRPSCRKHFVRCYECTACRRLKLLQRIMAKRRLRAEMARWGAGCPGRPA